MTAAIAGAARSDDECRLEDCPVVRREQPSVTTAFGLRAIELTAAWVGITSLAIVVGARARGWARRAPHGAPFDGSAAARVE